MKQKLELMLQSYKFLISVSKTYPVLCYKDMYDWAVSMDLFDQDFTEKHFEACFRACKQFSMQTEGETPLNSGGLRKMKALRAIRINKKKTVAGPDNTLTRFMFWEFVVRISFFKYKHSGIRLTVSECFVKFIGENLFEWQQSKIEIEFSPFLA